MLPVVDIGGSRCGIIMAFEAEFHKNKTSVAMKNQEWKERQCNDRTANNYRICVMGRSPLQLISTQNARLESVHYINPYDTK